MSLFSKVTFENSLENKKFLIFQVIIKDFNGRTILGHFQSLPFFYVSTQKRAKMLNSENTMESNDE